MSAWIVSQNHIRLLVEALYKYEVVCGNPFLPNVNPDNLGQMLWRENYRSVNYRYKKRACCPLYTHDSAALATWQFPSPGQGSIRDLVRNTGLLCKQIGCYNYQSCERPDWESTQAYQFMQALHKAVEIEEHHDYDITAPWGID